MINGYDAKGSCINVNRKDVILIKGDKGDTYDDTQVRTDINQLKETVKQIPTDNHINGLIDDKLGVIENGYY